MGTNIFSGVETTEAPRAGVPFRGLKPAIFSAMPSVQLHALHDNPQKNVGYRNVLPWRHSTCLSSVYQALSSHIGPGNEATCLLAHLAMSKH